MKISLWHCFTRNGLCAAVVFPINERKITERVALQQARKAHKGKAFVYGNWQTNGWSSYKINKPEVSPKLY